MATAEPAKDNPNLRRPSVTAIEEEQARTDALFRSIGDGVIATDEFGRVTRVNPSALLILGYSNVAEIIGNWYPNVFSIYNLEGAPIPLIDRPISKAFLTGKSVSENVLYLNKAGDMKPLNINVSPIIHNQIPIGAINVFRDITHDYNVDRMKSEFISLASHQLRTPLSTVKIYSHMLLDGYMGPVNTEQQKTLRTIVRAANRMNRLISTLLNIASMESGVINVTSNRVNLSRLLDDTVEDLSLTASTKKIELVLAVPKTPIVLRSDPLIIKEVVSNLVSNAIKYTQSGGRVEVQVKNRRSNIQIEVRDTGMGIPDSAKNQMFTKFFRGQNALKKETSGTGLGLYLVKGLVDALGGKIWFESKLNIGSTFFVSLPKAPQRKP